MQYAGGYSYAGSFLVSILGGITIIPVPSVLVIFTLGGVLNPVYVGLISGLGEALGGITVYLTGAGGGAVWSKFWSKGQTLEYQPGRRYDIVRLVQSKFWSRGEAFFNRLADWIGGRGSSWVVFITAAIIIVPFYFAGLAAGSLRMGLLRFFLVSWAGKTVRGLMVAFAGHWGLQFLLQWISG